MLLLPSILYNGVPSHCDKRRIRGYLAAKGETGGGSGVASVPHTAGAEAALRSEAQTSDRSLRSQIGGWDLRSEAEPWEGGGPRGVQKC